MRYPVPLVPSFSGPEDLWALLAKTRNVCSQRAYPVRFQGFQAQVYTSDTRCGRTPRLGRSQALIKNSRSEVRPAPKVGFLVGHPPNRQRA